MTSISCALSRPLLTSGYEADESHTIQRCELSGKLNAIDLNAEEQNIAPRFYKKQDPFAVLTDIEFKKEFRLTKNMATELIHQLSPMLQEESRRSALNTKMKVLVTLHFIANGSYQQVIGRNIFAAVSQPSVSRSITDITDVLNTRQQLDMFVKFPRNFQELRQIQQGFYEKFGLPGIVGCIDCTQVAIVAPHTNDPLYPEHIYVNRKGYHSINVQLICDVNCRILNVSAQFPGSTHDAYIWQNSDVNGLLQELTNRGHTSYLLGDSGYPLRPWLLTPIPNAAPGSAEERYNNTHRRIRATIERCNGILKSRFRCMLKHRVLHYLPERAAKIINVCVMMHNFCIDNQLPPPELVEDMDDLGMDVVFNEPNLLNNAYLAGRRQQERIVQQHFT
ncbi:hypothetical protein MML48_9g00005573 [Holotrichia oblita]|uniref:Uncharacterized protein n=1 Tax=Holotrichia oblita TaxID=644536 RepID=A0ACB9SKA6_HOLOL|nr:hypothetical protein MML48_9g00005573 [Holotrichia oblita]